MKKYITPAVEVQSVTSQNIMSVSFNVNESDSSEQLGRTEEFDIWED